MINTTVKQLTLDLIKVIFMTIAVGIISVVYYYSEVIGCKNRWELSQVNHKFDLQRGCIVEAKPNVWVPEDKFRFTDLK